MTHLRCSFCYDLKEFEDSIPNLHEFHVNVYDTYLNDDPNLIYDKNPFMSSTMLPPTNDDKLIFYLIQKSKKYNKKFITDGCYYTKGGITKPKPGLKPTQEQRSRHDCVQDLLREAILLKMEEKAMFEIGKYQ